MPEVAAAERWPRHPETTLGVARTVYLRLPAGSPLWDSARSFVLAEKRELVGVVGNVGSRTRLSGRTWHTRFAVARQAPQIRVPLRDTAVIE